MYKIINRLNKLVSLVIFVVPMTMVTGSVYAQGSNVVLEEVIVTATKRAKSLQDIPISVGVVTGEFINNFDVKDISDLQSFVPGLQVQQTFGSWAVRVRGLGSGITNLAFDSSVPVYVDGIYCGRGKCLESAFLDVERVEVARGPQGALFGKSTIAGAVSAITAKPTDDFEAEVKVGTELENGGETASGYISGPLSDTVSGRLAFKYEDLDGWVKNPFVSGDDGAKETQALRASLAWDVSDETQVNFKYETGESDAFGRNNQSVQPGALTGANIIAGGDAGAEFEPDDIRRVSTGIPTEDFYSYDWSLATLTMDTDVLDGHTLTAIAGWWEYDNNWMLEIDGGPFDILNTQLGDEYDQTTFELRLLSPSDQTIEYIVGAWYQESDLATFQSSPFRGEFFQAVGAPGFVILPEKIGTSRNFKRDTDAYSVYGQLTWNVNDRVSAVLDLRYTKEEQDATGYTFNAVYAADGLTPIRYTGPGPTLPNGFTLPSNKWAGFVTEYLFHENRTDDSLDPSLRIQFDVNDNAMLYVAYAEGSKAGGMKANDSGLGNTYLAERGMAPDSNGVTLQSGNGIFDFEDEEAVSYEIGIKSSLFDNRATLNAAIFHTEFDNLQTSSYNGTNFVIGNAAGAITEGIEIEGTLQATENLRLSAAIAYVDATYDDYIGVCLVPTTSACVDGRQDQSGETLERVPELEVNVTALWEQDLSDNLRLVASLSAYYSDEYNVRPTQAPFGQQDSFSKWDARVAVSNSDGSWQVGINGRNLTDEMVLNHAYPIAGEFFQSLGQGRTVTVDATFRF